MRTETRSKNICVLTQLYPDFPGSTHGIWMKPLYEEIACRGYSVNIVAPRVYGRSSRNEIWGKVRIRRFSFFAGDRLLDTCDKVPIFRMVVYFLSGFWSAMRIVLSRRCKIIHVHYAVPTGIIAIAIGILTGRKVIVTTYGTEINWFKWSSSRLIQALIRFVLNQAHIVTAISEYAAKTSARYLVDERKVFVTGVGGIDYRRMNKLKSQASVRDELHLGQEEYIILFIGSLARRKRVGDLLTVFSRVQGDIRNPRLVIIGKGEERSKLELLARELNIKSLVTFIDFVQEVPPYYVAADLFVLPSEEEGLGIVTMEAMAYGCPVLATRTSASLNLIREDEDGFLFEVGDIDDLERKIRSLYQNRGAAREVAEQAREKARSEFSFDKQVDNFLRIYEIC